MNLNPCVTYGAGPFLIALNQILTENGLQMHYERMQGSQSHKDKAQFHFFLHYRQDLQLIGKKPMFTMNDNGQGTSIFNQ